MSTTSRRAVNNLRAICQEMSGATLIDHYDIDVVDVLENPQLAERDKILATPTLIKGLPEPVRRIIGDLSDREKVLIGLDLIPIPAQAGATVKPSKLN